MPKYDPYARMVALHKKLTGKDFNELGKKAMEAKKNMTTPTTTVAKAQKTLKEANELLAELTIAEMGNVASKRVFKPLEQDKQAGVGRPGEHGNSPYPERTKGGYSDARPMPVGGRPGGENLSRGNNIGGPAIKQDAGEVGARNAAKHDLEIARPAYVANNSGMGKGKVGAQVQRAQTAQDKPTVNTNQQPVAASASATSNAPVDGAVKTGGIGVPTPRPNNVATPTPRPSQQTSSNNSVSPAKKTSMAPARQQSNVSASTVASVKRDQARGAYQNDANINKIAAMRQKAINAAQARRSSGGNNFSLFKKK